jgi:hypothetical protein
LDGDIPAGDGKNNSLLLQCMFMKEVFHKIPYTLLGRQHCRIFILYSRKIGTEKTFNSLVVTSKIDIRKFRESKKGDIIDKFYRQKPTQKQRQWFEGNGWKFVRRWKYKFQTEQILLYLFRR